MKKTYQPMNNKKGFTLTEVIAVMGIAGILFTLVIPSFSGIFTDVNGSTKDQNARGYYTYTYDAMTNAVANGQNNINTAQFAQIKTELELDALQVKYIKANGIKTVNAIWYKKGNVEGYYPSKEAFFETLEEVPDAPSPDRPVGPVPDPTPEPEPEPEPDPILPETPTDPGFNVENYDEWGDEYWYDSGEIVQYKGNLYVNFLGEWGNPKIPNQNRPDKTGRSWRLLRKDLFVEYDADAKYPAGTLLIYKGNYVITKAKKHKNNPLHGWEVVKIEFDD
ncbi:MAG: type II secretion system protein [Erysipelotrichaceae bacterium]